YGKSRQDRLGAVSGGRKSADAVRISAALWGCGRPARGFSCFQNQPNGAVDSRCAGGIPGSDASVTFHVEHPQGWLDDGSESPYSRFASLSAQQRIRPIFGVSPIKRRRPV